MFILVVFSHTENLHGWSREEIIFIYGYFLVPYAIFSTFFNFWDFNERYIIKGELDQILPGRYTVLKVIMETMTPESLFGVVTGLAVMGSSMSQMNYVWTTMDEVFFFLFVVVVRRFMGGFILH